MIKHVMIVGYGIMGQGIASSFVRGEHQVTVLIEQKDIGGLATTAATQRNLVPQLNHSGIPTQSLQDMVARGELGVKSGKGFYDWSSRDVEAHKKRAMEKLRRILEILAE